MDAVPGQIARIVCVWLVENCKNRQPTNQQALQTTLRTRLFQLPFPQTYCIQLSWPCWMSRLKPASAPSAISVGKLHTRKLRNRAVAAVAPSSRRVWPVRKTCSRAATRKLSAQWCRIDRSMILVDKYIHIYLYIYIHMMHIYIYTTICKYNYIVINYIHTLPLAKKKLKSLGHPWPASPSAAPCVWGTFATFSHQAVAYDRWRRSSTALGSVCEMGPCDRIHGCRTSSNS